MAKNQHRRICTFACFLLTALLLSACSQNSYGTVFPSQADLQAALEDANMDFLYPTYLGEKKEADTQEFIAAKPAAGEDYTGYKIYQFGTPFFVCVSAFAEVSDTLLGESPERVQAAGTLASAKGELRLFQGKGHNEALFLIGSIHLSGRHYEVRVSANNDMQDGKYVNAIYEDNALYTQACDVICAIVEGL